MAVDQQVFLERAGRLRRGILLALVAGTPAIVWRGLADAINMPKFGLLVIGVSLALGLRVAEGLQKDDWKGLSRLWVPAAALMVPLTVGWIFSPHKGWALLGAYTRFQGLIPYLVLALFGILLADGFAGRATDIARALALAAAAVGGYGLLQFAGADPFVWGIQGGVVNAATSTVGNPNFTGGFLAITIPVIAVLWKASPQHRLTSGLCLALAVGGWLVARSEGAWAAGVAAISVTLGLYARPRWRLAPIAGLAVAVIVSLFIVGLSLFAAFNHSEGQRVSETVALRGLWWAEAAAMGVDSPLVGRGPNSFALEGYQYRVPEEIERAFSFSNDPHSVPLSLWAATGILGLIGFGVLVVWTFRTTRRAETQGFLAMGFAGGATAYFVQALVSLDELTLRVGLWSCLAGLAVCSVSNVRRQTAKKRGRPRRAPLRKLPVVGVVGVLALGTVFWGARVVVADANAFSATKALASGDQEAFTESYESAISLNGWDEYRRQYGSSLGQLAVGQGQAGSGIKNEMDRVFMYLDGHPDHRGFMTYGVRLEEWGAVAPGALQEALIQFQRAMHMNPLDPFVRVKIADVLIQLDKAPEALDVLNEVRHLAARYPEWWGAVSIVHASLHEHEAAQDAIERARALDRAEPRIGIAQELLDEYQPE